MEFLSMHLSPRLYIRDPWIAIPGILIVLNQIAIWWFVVAHIRPTQDQFFLHYNSLFGVDLVGEWWKLYSIPIVATGLCIFNSILAFFLHNSERLLSRFLLVFSIFFSIALSLAMYFIVGLNS